MEHLELKKENDWNLSTTNFTTSDKKCGEIFIETNKGFYIVCTFCNIQLKDFEQFTTHYSQSHAHKSASYLDDPLSTMKIEIENDPIINNNPVSEIDDPLSTMKIEIEDPIINNNPVSEIDDPLITMKIEIENNSIINNNPVTEIVSDLVSKTTSRRNRREKVLHTCDLCKKTFVNEKKLENHKKYDHLPIDESFINNSSVSSEPNPNSHLSGNDERNKSKSQTEIDLKNCRYCDRKFDTRFKRIQHERIHHTGESPFKCKHCGKAFLSSGLCTQHENIHLGIKPHKCDLCNMSFASKPYLTLHLRRHAGEKSHACSFCEKKFFDNAEKVIHERTHTGEKPYQCITCGKCFATCSNLSKHRKFYHKNDDKSFTCKKNAQLLMHSKTLSDIKPNICKICNITFKDGRGLHCHEKIHSNAINYTCDVCGKEFKQYPGWNRHSCKSTNGNS